jgi:glucosamine--fructose-6-phosphate aminotransferase (isomerizing)
MSFHEEIFEQPERLQHLLRQRKQVELLAAAIHQRGIDYAFVAARGTSDNAARYANYTWGAQNGLPVALATPSLFTYYHHPPRLGNALVLGISQAGASPDIVSVLDEGGRQGCLTLAVTNTPSSPLASVASLVLDIQAGPEKAVAASKTYTCELLAIAMLSAALRNNEEMWDQLESLPGWVGTVLELDAMIECMAERYRYMNHCAVLGRGYNYSTAFEWALKLKELAYLVAEPYSSADFLHGPIAMVAGGFPILAVAPRGKVFSSLFKMLSRLQHDQQAELVVISDEPRILAMAQSAIPLPAGIPEWLTPLVSIVPAQLFACHLTHAKGYNTERPRALSKVTETQ